MKQKSRYAESGVDIEAGDRVKKRIAELARHTHCDKVLHKDGAFGGLFALKGLKEKNPVLVSSVDGVGTKVKLACAAGRHKGIGADIVNHCINDILACGARPLFFLDYFACGRQNDEVVLQLIEGMSDACRAAGMALIGGETAQMPDVYAADEYDVAGTIVGVVDELEIINGKDIAPGDSILGLPSSGLHTNGYTLARKVLLEENGFRLDDIPKGLSKTLGEELLTPHRSYLNEFQKIRAVAPIKGVAHITGGGFEGNISRILPDNCQAAIHPNRWQTPQIFRLIQDLGRISWEEMHRVFNMGIGIVFILSARHEEKAKEVCPEAINIGEITAGSGVTLIRED
ncbi:MAG: phosphoribosylformylglycinamidine cyclo-ligase [Candidatus Omnitrophota bacterium]